MNLSHHEKMQLRSIGGGPYGKGSPYWWGAKTMPRLAEKGLVEPHHAQPKAWQITSAGRAELARLLGNQATLQLSSPQTPGAAE